MPLNEEQRQHFEKRLQEERERLTRTLDRKLDRNEDESQQEQSGDLTSMPLHPADIGTDTMRDELEASNMARMSSQLTEIDAALERLYREPERYGVCEDTGQPIPLERLEIIPWARTCEMAEAEGNRVG